MKGGYYTAATVAADTMGKALSNADAARAYAEAMAGEGYLGSARDAYNEAAALYRLAAVALGYVDDDDMSDWTHDAAQNARERADACEALARDCVEAYRKRRDAVAGGAA